MVLHLIEAKGILALGKEAAQTSVIHAFSFPQTKHHEPRPSGTKLLLPIIPISIVACAFVLLWGYHCQNNCIHYTYNCTCNIINQPIDLDDMTFATHNTFFTFTWLAPFVTQAINFSVYVHKDKLSIIPWRHVPHAKTQNLLTYFKEIFLVFYTQLKYRPWSITYPDLSGADSVTKTFKRFFCSVALFRISNTTLDREWVRIVWEKKKKNVKNTATNIWPWI